MKKFNLNSRSARKGGIAFAITAIVIAIIICLNMIIGQVPANYKEFDISDQRIYSVSETAKEYVSNLATDIEIVIIASEESLDPRVSKYIYNYGELSDYINVSEVDPVMYPSALENYNCAADTVVVYSPITGKMAQIPIYGSSGSIIVYEVDQYSYSYVESRFDAEGLITSAIDYVTSNATNTVYALTGHGETPLSASASDKIAKANIVVNPELNLLVDGGIPANCNLLICNNPTADLAADELAMIKEYLANGGDMILLMDYAILPNFNTLMGDYGLAVQPGFLGETELYYAQYAQQYGYFCMAPTFSGTGITEGINSNAMLIYPRALLAVSPARNTITVDPFMATSANGIYFENTEAEGVLGEYLIGAVASEETKNGTANFTVVSAVTLIDQGITDSYTSMSNLDIFLNMVTYGMENTSSISIPAKSLGITYNTFTNYGIWAIIFVFVLPITWLVCGLIIWIRRRKR